MGEVSSENCSCICVKEVSALDAVVDVTRADSEAGSLKEFQASNPSCMTILFSDCKIFESHLAQVIVMDRGWVGHVVQHFVSEKVLG